MGGNKGREKHPPAPTTTCLFSHVLLCVFLTVCVAPLAVAECALLLAVCIVRALLISLSLLLPLCNWWERAQLALTHVREAALTLALILSLCVPGVLALAVLRDKGGWRLRHLVTLCGHVDPHRSSVVSCFFPALSGRKHYTHEDLMEEDGCLPSGPACLEACCACSCGDCLDICCARGRFLEETPFVSPLATPASTPGGTPTTKRRLSALAVAAAAAQSNNGGSPPSFMNGGSVNGSNAAAANGHGATNGGAEPTSASAAPTSPTATPNNSSSRLPAVSGGGSPRTDRRGGSLRRRYKALAFKPAAAHASMEEHLTHVLSFDISGDYLVTTTGNGTIYIWNVYTHECVMMYPAPSVKVTWSPRGDLIASSVITPSSSHVHLYDFVNGREALRIPTQHRLKPLDNISWSKDGLYLAVTGDSKVGTVQQQVS